VGKTYFVGKSGNKKGKGNARPEILPLKLSASK
jgi:hypothetical protein